MALPRSWLLRQISTSSLPAELAKRAPRIYWMLLDPMAALLEDIYTGVGAGECNFRLFPSQMTSLNLLTSKNTFSSIIRVSQLYGVSVGCLLLACVFSPIRTQITRDLNLFFPAAELYAFVSSLSPASQFLIAEIVGYNIRVFMLRNNILKVITSLRKFDHNFPPLYRP